MTATIKPASSVVRETVCATTLLMALVAGCGPGSAATTPAGRGEGTAGGEGMAPSAHATQTNAEPAETPPDAGATAVSDGLAPSLDDETPAGPPPSTGPLDNLAARLAYSNTIQLRRVQRSVLKALGDRTMVEMVAFSGAGETVVCLRIDVEQASCWRAPLAAAWMGNPSVTHSGGTIDITFVGFRSLRFEFSDCCIRTMLSHTDTVVRFDEFVPTAAPATLDDFSSLTVLGAGRRLLLSHDGRVVFCSRRAGVFTCAAPVALVALADSAHYLVEFTHEMGDLFAVGVAWELPSEGGETIEFLRLGPNGFQELAVVLVAFERYSERTADRPDVEVLSVQAFGVEARRLSCIHVPTPVIERRLEPRDGRARTLSPPRLARAPNTVPLAGVDPLAVNLRGAWELVPTGGLRRIARCEYDEEEMADLEDDEFDE